jgi:hypothetical protein
MTVHERISLIGEQSYYDRRFGVVRPIPLKNCVSGDGEKFSGH